MLQAVPVEYIAPRGADIFDLGLTPVTLDLLSGGALAWFLLPNDLDSVSYIELIYESANLSSSKPCLWIASAILSARNF